MRIADSPGLCSSCYGAKPDVKHVDFECAFDGQPVLAEDGTIAMSPANGLLMSHDDLIVCEQCLREACELVGLKPELHRRQLREIKRLEIQRDHWRDTAKRAQEELDRQIDANLEATVA